MNQDRDTSDSFDAPPKTGSGAEPLSAFGKPLRPWQRRDEAPAAAHPRGVDNPPPDPEADLNDEERRFLARWRRFAVPTHPTEREAVPEVGGPTREDQLASQTPAPISAAHERHPNPVGARSDDEGIDDGEAAADSGDEGSAGAAALAASRRDEARELLLASAPGASGAEQILIALAVDHLETFVLARQAELRVALVLTSCLGSAGDLGKAAKALGEIVEISGVLGRRIQELLSTGETLRLQRLIHGRGFGK